MNEKEVLKTKIIPELFQVVKIISLFDGCVEASKRGASTQELNKLGREAAKSLLGMHQALVKIINENNQCMLYDNAMTVAGWKEAQEIVQFIGGPYYQCVKKLVNSVRELINNNSAPW